MKKFITIVITALFAFVAFPVAAFAHGGAHHGGSAAAPGGYGGGCHSTYGRYHYSCPYGYNQSIINLYTDYTNPYLTIPTYINGAPVTTIGYDTTAGLGAFANHTELRSVSLPSSVKSISGSAFKNCTNLTKLVVPKSVTSIGAGAVANCPKVTVYCYYNSAAYRYAKTNKLKYSLLDPAPAAPKTVKNAGTTYKSAKISWSAVSGASGYNIYRSTDGKNFKYIQNSRTTSVTNTGLAASKPYYYKIRAYKNIDGKQLLSGYSPTIKVATAVAPPTAPVQVKAQSVNSSTITISWKPVSGASGYEIYRSEKNTSNYQRLSTRTTTSLKDGSLKSNTTYYYKVRAYKLVKGAKLYGGFGTQTYTKTAPVTTPVTTPVTE